MAFVLQNLNRTSSGTNSKAPAFYSYSSSTDNAATIEADGYFSSFASSLRVGDSLYINASDGPGFLVVTDVSPVVKTSAVAVIGPGGVGSAQLQAGAVDNAAVDPVLIQFASLTLTAAEWNGMWAAPVELIPAPGPNKLIVVKDAVLDFRPIGGFFANGGDTGLQYSNTPALAAAQATFVQTAATLNGFGLASSVGLIGTVAASANIALFDQPICISNKTAAYTGGGTSLWGVYVWYSVI